MYMHTVGTKQCASMHQLQQFTLLIVYYYRQYSILHLCLATTDVIISTTAYACTCMVCILKAQVLRTSVLLSCMKGALCPVRAYALDAALGCVLGV
jgi:hypothetical protein